MKCLIMYAVPMVGAGEGYFSLGREYPYVVFSAFGLVGGDECGFGVRHLVG